MNTNEEVRVKKPKKAAEMTPAELSTWLEEKFAETGEEHLKFAASALRNHTRCALGGTDFVITGSEDSLKYVQTQLIKAAGL